MKRIGYILMYGNITKNNITKDKIDNINIIYF